MYQTFDDEQGDSDSYGKLCSLKLPELSGKSVLDLGCNEGFFCSAAKGLGASRVVGTDVNSDLIQKARSRFTDIEFMVHDWSYLSRLGGEFDVVLLLSAFHYAKDKCALIADIADKMAPGGLFILESGIADGDEEEWVEVERFNDVVLHPTRSALENLLRMFFSVRCVGESVKQNGDPLPRYVYHCRKLMPVAMIISGDSGDGKSTLAHMVGAHTISWDIVFSDNSLGDNRFIDRDTDRMVDDGKSAALLDIVKHYIDVKSGLVVLEGYGFGVEPLRSMVKEYLDSEGFYVWDVIRS